MNLVRQQRLETEGTHAVHLDEVGYLLRGLSTPVVVSQRPYYNYTCQPGDFIKTCSVPSPLLNEKDLEREKRILEI